jgi:hypothetical protein
MTKRCIGFAATILVLLLVPTLSFGQVTAGSIAGTVTDPQGAAVANATVTVTDVAKGTTDTATTNDSGNYTVTHLIPDPYSVKVEAQGFKTFTQTGVNVVADATKRVDAQLQVGSTSETLEVTAEIPQLQTENADVGITYNDTYVENLPILNRNFTTFQLLSPGTQKLAGWSHAATENPQGGQQIMVQGQHFSGTGFQLDGTDNQDPILGIIVINPNLDAITQATVGSQFYDAEQGKAVAGLVTAQTKSGTNQFHGSGFWFRRTDANEARDPFTQFAKNSVTGRYIPSDKWNQYGGTIGGPIIKNKLFFFGDYQGTKETTGVTWVLTVPTALAHNSCTQTMTCNLSEYLTSQIGGGGQVYKPNVNNQAGFDNLANMVPGNLLPVADLSPQALAVLKMLPMPTGAGVLNNFVAAGSGSYKQNAFDTRIDYTLNQSNNIYGRFSLAYFTLSGNPSFGQLGSIGFGPGPGLAGSSNVHNYSLATGWTHTFSPSFLMDVHFGWFKYNPQTAFFDQGQNPMTALGIPGLNMGNYATSGLSYFNMGGNTGNNGGQNHDISDFGNGLGVQRCNCPLTERENQYQWVANFTKIRGNHTIKFGGDFRYATNLRVPSDQNRAGEMTFSQNATSDPAAMNTGGLALATFLYGAVTHFDRYASTSLNASEHQYRFFAYGQDTWRVTPKLTVNYGLRWELYTPEAVNARQNGGFCNIINGFCRVAGVGPWGLNGNISNQLYDFAPRFGIAYQIYDKTVIRAGFGVSYDIGVFGSNFGHTVTQNLPVLVAQQVNASTFNGNSNSDSYAPAYVMAPGAGYLNPVNFPGLLTQPPLPNFCTPVPATGVLPLQGCTGQTSPRVRPLQQRVPYIYAYNLTVQQQLDRATTLTLSYVGNLGRHGFVGDGPNYNVNQPQLNGVRPLGNKFTYPGYTNPDGTVLTCCSQDIGNYFGNDANSNYNALVALLERQMSHGLQFVTHFTWSKSNHYDSNYYVDVPRIAYGPYDQNRSWVWVFNAVYNLPFGKGQKYGSNVSGWVNEVIGGWQITDTTNWSGGLPWTPTLNTCPNINSSAPCRPDNGLGTLHTGVGPLIRPAGGAQPYRVFYTPVPINTVFAAPGPNRIGNAGFDSYWGPRAFTDDMSIAKNFQITERFRFQFRMDAFNIFNHPALNFSNTQNPGTCVANDSSKGGFGTCGSNNGTIRDILFGTTMRQLQFGLHLFF